MNRFAQIWRHLWRGEREARRVFPAAALARIEEAVTASEILHRGELRVVIQGGTGWASLLGVPDSRSLALMHFAQQGVWNTEEHAGVLIYLLMAEHRLEIVADRGIHRCVPQAEWDAIAQIATRRFAAGDYLDGLLAAQHAVGVLLSSHFPADLGDPDELPNAPLRL